jgi:hypothetical protein
MKIRSARCVCFFGQTFASQIAASTFQEFRTAVAEISLLYIPSTLT